MKAFVLNTEVGRVHKAPTQERCNMDDTLRNTKRAIDLKELRAYKLRRRLLYCRWCFPTVAGRPS